MYCVNCGVELADSETVCPLCGTRVFHPDLSRPQADAPYPPDHHVKPEDVSRSGVLFVMTMLALLPAVICLLCSALTLFMQNSGVAAMITPIVIPMAMEMGIDPVAWVVVVAVGTNLAIATPIGTAVNMQILPAGYTFKDFALLGGPLWLLMTIVVTICSVLFLI